MHRAICMCLLLTITIGYINPVQGERDSPDPGVIYINGYYLAVTTSGWGGKYFPIWRSQTGTNFTQVGWAMPNPPAWTSCCDYWAPQIHQINGHFVLYYSARDKAGILSIGSATSPTITGTFFDKGSPLVHNASEGVIDATILKDGVSAYVVYKLDGNAHSQPTLLYAIKLDPTGMGTQGNAVLLLKNDQAWERGIVEGQWFIKEGNYYYLFYSGCGYDNDCYAVGVARSSSSLGPYEKYSNNPILKTRSTSTSRSWQGPGHCSVIKSPNNKWLMFYHSWPHGAVGTKRVMLMDEVIFVGGWPKVGNGSPSEEQVPDP